MGICCRLKNKLRKQGVKDGLLAGLLPHSCCIAFILLSVLGATSATFLLKPFLLNPYFFWILMAISVILATVSSFIYLKRSGCISLCKNSDNQLELEIQTDLVKKEWKYLASVYGSVIGVNLLFFLVIFPLAMTGFFVKNVQEIADLSALVLKVSIPCPGHAPLVVDELKRVDGVINVKYNWPNIFEIYYDSKKLSVNKILSLEIFNSFKATVESEINTGSPSLEKSSPESKGLSTGCPCGCPGGCR
jgi:hypothetical protein